MYYYLHESGRLPKPTPFPGFMDRDAHLRARSLVRLERPAHNRAVVGSNPSGPTHFEPNRGNGHNFCLYPRFCIISGFQRIGMHLWFRFLEIRSTKFRIVGRGVPLFSSGEESTLSGSSYTFTPHAHPFCRMRFPDDPVCATKARNRNFSCGSRLHPGAKR